MNKPIGDVYLVAALLSYGFTLLKHDKTDVNKQTFEFEDENRLVYFSDGLSIGSSKKSLNEIELLFLSKRLLFPGSYPTVLKDLKFDIVHTRNDRKF